MLQNAQKRMLIAAPLQCTTLHTYCTAVPHLRHVGRFDDGDEATRFQTLIASGCSAGIALQAAWTQLQTETQQEGIFASGPEAIGAWEDVVQPKVQRYLTKQREIIRVRKLNEDILRDRPRRNPERVAWRQLDEYGRAFIGSLPSRQNVLGNRDLIETMHEYYGLPNPAYAHLAGRPILTSGNVFDANGWTLAGMNMIGDGFRRRHNALLRHLYHLAKLCGVELTVEPETLFYHVINNLNAFQQLSGEMRRGLIPDFLLRTLIKEQLYDLKTLQGNALLASDVPGGAVQSREKRGHKEYLDHAHQIDVDHNNWTGARNGGPVSRVLKRYGTVQILVFALHRVSNHVKKFVDHLATTAARNWAREGARTRQEAKATYKTMLVNTIGISNACGSSPNCSSPLIAALLQLFFAI